jgi:hypothetical protein
MYVYTNHIGIPRSNTQHTTHTLFFIFCLVGIFLAVGLPLRLLSSMHFFLETYRMYNIRIKELA